MQSHKSVHLYLDCDTTGQKCIQKALEIDKQKFIDERHLYKNYKDLNDWIMHIGQSQKQVGSDKAIIFLSTLETVQYYSLLQIIHKSSSSNKNYGRFYNEP